MKARQHTCASLSPRAFAAAMLLVATAACNPGTGAPEVPAARGKAAVSVSLSSATEARVARVTVAVSPGSGPDFATLNFDLARSSLGWSGFLTGIPTGPGRRFDVSALDAAGATLATGWGKSDILPGIPASVTILITGSSPPIANQAPVIDYAAASADAVGPGGSLTVRVSASDPDPADTITYSWSATCGAFDDSRATVSIWTAPSAAGACELTITVSDGKASTSAVLNVTVRNLGRSVAGTRLVTHWPDPPAVKAAAPAPDTLASLPPQILLPAGSGGWTVLPGGHLGPGGAFVEGSFGSDGSFVVPSVPPGDYVLCHRPLGDVVTCLDGASDDVDLGYDVLGRADQSPAARSTAVTLAFTGMHAWNPLLDKIEITSSGANVWDEVTAGSTLRGGEVAATLVEDWNLGNGVREPMNLLGAADVLFAHQLSVRSFYTGHDIHFYVAATHAAPAPAGISLADGKAASIATALQPLALSRTVDVDWDPAAFEAYQPALGPPARTALGATPHRFTVAANAFSLVYPSPAAAGTPDLVSMTLPAGAARATGSVWYGRFLPSQWNEWQGVSLAAEVSYLAPGASRPWIESSEIERRDALPASAGAFAPAVTPATAPQIGGVDAFQDRMGVGETPVLSWSAPSKGSPTGYVVEVCRLDAKGGATTRTSVLRYNTPRHSIRLPPGVLEAGATYFARITALVSTAPIAAPYREASVLAQASALTGTFTR
jgi:hypothetical protein